MKTTRIITGSLVLTMIAMLLAPPGTMAQDSGGAEGTDGFSKEELTQMLAPIALYPDSLVAEMLMASTYPLEIVEAERWLRQNSELKGDALNTALQEKTWDPSVKSLCHFPDVLFAMSDKLDQTRKLGDAFLGQEDEVMAIIQELRRRADSQGNLTTTEQQKVIIEEETIRIEPPAPEVAYVPVYDPLYVYGPWWYPDYPPYYWYYPPGFFSGGYISYGPRIFLGFGWSSWAWFDWHVHHIHVDVHKTKRFHKHHDKRDFDRPYWRHNPRHRRGVAYRDTRTSERFRQRPARVSPVSPEMRGYPGRRFDRQERRLSPAPSERGRGTVTPRVGPERERIQRTPARQDTPFRGIGDGNFERRAGERGSESRQSREIGRPGGGMRRPTGEIRQPHGGGMRQPGGGMRQPGGGSRGGGSSGGGRR